jgi:sulfate transport system permease protein
LIPMMESQGVDDELAALSLGASGLQTFRRVTIPNIRWAMLYGVVLCTCRAFGEFGAVSVVSGNTDANDTMPLRVEKLWQGYNSQAAFAVASLLASLAVITLIIKAGVDWRRSRISRAAEMELP